MTKKRQIAIIGGTGGMGQVFAKQLKSHADILIISRSLEKANRFAEKIGVQGGTLQDCSTADIVIVSVPIEHTYQTCINLFPIVKSNSLIIDISAVKTHLKKILDQIPNNISYISMHPLFGPEGSFKDYNVILVPIKDDSWLPEIKALLSKLGSLVSTITAEEHDFIMSKIQVAHHFVHLLLAAYLSESSIPPKFFTRSFKKTLSNFQGIEANLKAILEIQESNPHAEKTRTEIAALVDTLITIDKEKLSQLTQKIQIFKQHYLEKKE